MRDLLVAADFSLLADESTDEAGRAQLSMFVRFIEITTNLPKEEFICVHKLGASKTSEAIMIEIEEMFVEKHINKSFIRFSGLDGTNCMSGVQNGLQRRIQHISPYAFYINCRNHRLALCLVHLLKEYVDLSAVDILLLSIWKTFKYSSVKQAIFENAQVLEGMPPLKILKACTTRWLTHGDTSVRVISRFRPLVAALDTIFTERKDPEAKGIRDQLLSPNIILMLLLLAEVLGPINLFCKSLQTQNLNYGLVVVKFKRLITRLERIEEELSNHGSLDTELKYFNQESDLLGFSAEAMSLARHTRADAVVQTDADISDYITNFLSTFGKPLVNDLMTEIEKAMEETSPVLSVFDLFNPESLDKSHATRKQYAVTLCEHYGRPLTDSFHGQSNVALPIINEVEALSELDGFAETFDHTVNLINEKEKQKVVKLVAEGALPSGNARSYLSEHIPTSADVYKIMSMDESPKIYKHLMHLYQISLLIPPSTANVERGFSIMNLLCTPLRSSLSETSLDRLMRICINGPETLSEEQLEELVDDFKKMRDNRRLDL